MSLQTTLAYFMRPMDIVRNYDLRDLRPDLFAGLTVGVVLLPQAIAFSLVAGLPPEMGLYSAIIVSIIAALWGSSHHLNSGPTNSSALLIFSILVPLVPPDTAAYAAAAGLLAVMIGFFRLVMGLIRLGMLVTFLSDSVIVGFTAGAGVLICVGQLRYLLGLSFPNSPNLGVTLWNVVVHLPQTHLLTLSLGVGALIGMIVLKQLDPRWPGALAVMLGASLLVAFFDLEQAGVRVLGHIPHGFPPLAGLPLFDIQLIGHLSTGALALATIGLVEAVSIARSIANQTGQRPDNNQEFVGQGLANMVCGFFSGYPCSGSFNRSAINYKSNAQTAVSSVIAGLFVLAASFLLAPLLASIPFAVMASVLILAAYGMVNWPEMVRIWRGTRGDRVIMVVTLLATLLLPLQFAIVSGIIMSLAYYILQTSMPRVVTVLPDDEFRHFTHQPGKPPCPQLGIVDIMGDLYFGATSHVEEALHQHMNQHAEERFLLLRMHTVLHCDISGINTLESIVRAYREKGGDVFFTRVQEPVLAFMQSTGFCAYVGTDHFLAGASAISHLFYKVIDPAVCIYECNVRAFRECQNLPKQTCADRLPPLPADIPADGVRTIVPQALWQQLRADPAPLVLDVREPREYHQGHIPNARVLPLPRLLSHMPAFPPDQPVVVVCRSGRRSRRAASIMLHQGYTNVVVLQGGMLAWKAAGLLEAVE